MENADVDKLKRRQRVIKRQLTRQREQFEELVSKSTLNLEQLGRLESMVKSYKSDLEKLQEITNEILEQFDGDEDEFEPLETLLMDDLKVACDAFHVAEARCFSCSRSSYCCTKTTFVK
jgi:predicted nuclease with TOPRIM domain